MKKIIATALLLATPAYADPGNGNGLGSGGSVEPAGTLHSYSNNPIDKEVGLCHLAEHYGGFRVQPCWWN